MELAGKPRQEEQEAKRRQLVTAHLQRIQTTPQEVLAEQLADTELANQQELERLKRENKNLKESAGKDTLTGLDNRRTFDEEIHRAVVAALRSGKPISVIFLDIDRFKEINDKQGHLAGDAVLQGVSSEIKLGIRETDRACRYGGEEIVVILPDTPLNQAVGVAERLRRKIAASPTAFEGIKINATASSGVGSFSPTNSGIQIAPDETKTIIDQLKNNADKAMYAAKAAGRNRTGFTSPDGRVGILEQDPTNHSKLIAKYQGS